MKKETKQISLWQKTIHRECIICHEKKGLSQFENKSGLKIKVFDICLSCRRMFIKKQIETFLDKIKYGTKSKAKWLVRSRIPKFLLLKETKMVVYFLCLSNKIQYIGSSYNFHFLGRVSNHLNNKKIPFNKVEYLCLSPSLANNVRTLHIIEAAFIRHYKPPYNKEVI